MATMDVTCPSGVIAGDLITVTLDGVSFDVELPLDIHEGEIFQVALPAGVDAPSLPVLGVVAAQLEAAGGTADVTS